LTEGGLDVGVLIPTAVAVLDEAHSGFGKPACQQALPAEAVGGVLADTVDCQRNRTLPAEIHDIGHGVLHAERKFVAFDSAFDEWCMSIALQFFLIKLVDQIDLCTLLTRAEKFIPDISQTVVVFAATAFAINRTVALAAAGNREARSPVGCRQKGAAEISRPTEVGGVMEMKQGRLWFSVPSP